MNGGWFRDRLSHPDWGLGTGDWGLPASHEAKRVGDRRLHLAPIDDQVEHAFLEQELAALKSLGQLLPNRLFDDARAGETDERLRLGNVEIAEHGEARRDAAGGGVGEHREERQLLAI